MSEHDRREAKDQDQERETRNERREERREDIRIEERKEDKVADKTLIECLTRIETKIDASLGKLIDFQNKILAAFVALIGAVIGEKFIGTPPLYAVAVLIAIFATLFAAIRLIYSGLNGNKFLVVALLLNTANLVQRIAYNLGSLEKEFSDNVSIILGISMAIFLILYGIFINKRGSNEARKSN